MAPRVATIITDGYVFDSSALIDLHHRYPRDVFPQIWRSLERLIRDGRACSPREVLNEIRSIDDDLAEWAKEQGAGLFLHRDAQLWSSAQRVAEDYPGLIVHDAERPTADPFVVALASVQRWTVVAVEGRSNNPRKPRMPDVCDELEIRYIGLVQLFRDEGWKTQ